MCQWSWKMMFAITKVERVCLQVIFFVVLGPIAFWKRKRTYCGPTTKDEGCFDPSNKWQPSWQRPIRQKVGKLVFPSPKYKRL